ncbi:MAG: Hpt domain-containing protein [Bacteroidetes bacterium]|nr:Hpt domain-containing protein [Bacteroidota bacterium]
MKNNKHVCDFSYLSETMGEKKHLVKEIIDVFLKQVPEELQSINNAITKADYSIIKNSAHTMKSSVSIMGISELAPVLQEMEALGATASNIEKIKALNQKLDFTCKQAIKEIEREKQNYT